MVRAKTKAKPKQEYLSPSERQGLEEEKRDLENTLTESQNYGGEGQIDTARIQGEIRRLDTEIGSRTPAEARGQQKDKLIKEEKELEDQYSQGLPTWYEMHNPTKNPGAVRKHMDHSDRNKELVKRYRELQRILRPTAPKSLEALRKEK